MKMRCLNVKHPTYPLYGARGISICPQWFHSFTAFLTDVGVRPSLAYSLERIDNDGNYEPGNVRWATDEEQGQNRRTNVIKAEDVPFILHWYSKGYTQRAIAEAFNGKREMVSKIIRGTRWKNIAGDSIPKSHGIGRRPKVHV